MVQRIRLRCQDLIINTKNPINQVKDNEQNNIEGGLGSVSVNGSNKQKIEGEDSDEDELNSSKAFQQ